MPNPVVHFEITGPNGSALQEFYRGLFDYIDMCLPCRMSRKPARSNARTMR